MKSPNSGERKSQEASEERSEGFALLVVIPEGNLLLLLSLLLLLPFGISVGL